MIIDVQQFQKSLKGMKGFPPVFLIVGDEESLVSESAKEIDRLYRERFPSEMPEFNIERLHADRDDAARITDSCWTLPLGTEKKLVTVHHLEKASADCQSELAAYCRSPNPSTCLVLLWNAKPAAALLKKELPTEATQTGCVVKCWSLYEERRPSWVMEKVKQMGKSIAQDAAELLAREGGESLNELKSEIEKLFLFVEDRKEIKLSDVRETMSFRRNESIWDLTESLDKGEIKKAGQILENCLDQGEEPVRLLNLITYSCRKWASSHPARAKQLFLELKRSDLALKTGQGKESAIFERILQILERQA